jgi:hypothetical protein
VTEFLEQAVATTMEASSACDEGALLDLAAFLKAHLYQFVTPTPATHARVLARTERRKARDLRDIFGWSLPFDPTLLPTGLFDRLDSADLFESTDDGLKSRLRVSSLGKDLFLHSAYPTDGRDSVFFGPDSYRFASLIDRELARIPGRTGGRLVDVGTGAGVGAIVAAHLCPTLKIAMTDINPAALRLAQANARIAGVTATACLADTLSSITGVLDLILANPPYIIDESGRTYRDGGAMHGAAVSLAMARDAVPRLAEGGRFILYTGSAIVGGGDALREALAKLAGDHDCMLRYEEIDPDVFGEELDNPAYRDVDRIALVSAVMERTGRR